MVPRLARVVLLFNPPTATFIEGFVGPFKSAAAAIGAEAIIGPVNDMPDLESLIATEAREANSGLVVIPDAFTIPHRAEIIAVAACHRVPAVYWSRSFTELGGLISYGPYIIDEYRRAAGGAHPLLTDTQTTPAPARYA